jgi:hypothetical protein
VLRNSSLPWRLKVNPLSSKLSIVKGDKHETDDRKVNHRDMTPIETVPEDIPSKTQGKKTWQFPASWFRRLLCAYKVQARSLV